MTASTSEKFRSQAFVIPALLFLAAFFLLPLIWIILISFSPSGHTDIAYEHWTLENYKTFLSDGYYLYDLLWRTVRISVIATVLSVVVGYIGTLAIIRAKPTTQTWLLFLCMCPLWVNLVVRTLSLMLVLGRDGAINKLMLWLGMINSPMQLLYNETAVILGMVQVSVPFVVLSLYGVLKSIPRDLEQAAMSVGAGPIASFMRVTLPLSIPGLLAGGVLALGINIESFVVPTLLGGGRVRFMSVAAYESATISNNLPFAATIGVVLLIVTLLILGIYQFLLKPRRTDVGPLRSV